MLEELAIFNLDSCLNTHLEHFLCLIYIFNAYLIRSFCILSIICLFQDAKMLFTYISAGI